MMCPMYRSSSSVQFNRKNVSYQNYPIVRFFQYIRHILYTSYFWAVCCHGQLTTENVSFSTYIVVRSLLRGKTVDNGKYVL